MNPLSVVLGVVFGVGLVAAGGEFLGHPLLGPGWGDGARLRLRRLEKKWDQLALRTTLGVGGAVVVFLLTVWPVAAVLGGVCGFYAPGLLTARRRRMRTVERVEAIAMWAEMLRDILGASGGLEQSIRVSADVAPTAIGDEVRNLAAMLGQGERTSVALRLFADEVADPTGDLVVAALIHAAESNPGRLADLLGRLAGVARAQVDLRLRIDSGRARVRSSVRIITGVTFSFGLGLVLFNPVYVEVYGTVEGQVVLAVVEACYIGSFAWLARGSRMRAPQRLLVES